MAPMTPAEYTEKCRRRTKHLKARSNESPQVRAHKPKCRFVPTERSFWVSVVARR
jgi:hypothetical protein